MEVGRDIHAACSVTSYCIIILFYLFIYLLFVCLFVCSPPLTSRLVGVVALADGVHVAAGGHQRADRVDQLPQRLLDVPGAHALAPPHPRHHQLLLLPVHPAAKGKQQNIIASQIGRFLVLVLIPAVRVH